MPRLFKFERYGVAHDLTDIKPHIFMNCKNVSSRVVYTGLGDCEDTINSLYIWYNMVVIVIKMKLLKY